MSQSEAEGLKKTGRTRLLKGMGVSFMHDNVTWHHGVPQHATTRTSNLGVGLMSAAAPAKAPLMQLQADIVGRPVATAAAALAFAGVGITMAPVPASRQHLPTMADRTGWRTTPAGRPPSPRR